MTREYWKPERKEIEERFEKKIQEFVIKENHSTRLAKKLENRYILIESYEIFFIEL